MTRFGLTSLCLLVIASSIGAAVWPGVANAAPGDLDPAFDEDGRAWASVGQNGITVYDAALQPDDGVTIVGTTGDGKGPTNFDVAVLRFRSNGSLDRRFDGDGRLTLDYTKYDHASSVDIAPDGSAVVGVAMSDAGIDVIRLKANGELDRRFSEDGATSLGLEAGAANATVDVAVAPDGGVIALYRRLVDGPDAESWVVRLTPGGDVDKDFGPTELSLGGSQDVVADSVEIDPHGRTLVSGSYQAPGSEYTRDRYFVARVGPDGVLDPGFGNGGIYSVAGQEGETRLALSPDGDIYFAATFAASLIHNAVYVNSLLQRLHDDGALASDLTPRIEDTFINGIDVAGPGELVIATSHTYYYCLRPSGAVLKFVGGELDPEFGYDRPGVAPVYGYTNQVDLEIDGEGRIVLMGSAGGAAADRFLTVDATPDFDADGVDDPSDACDVSFAPSTKDGCVRIENEVLIERLRSIVRANIESDERACESRRPLTIYREEDGPDFEVESAPATFTGRLAVRGSDLNPGRYYARASGVQTLFGACPTARSTTVRVSPRSFAD